MAAAATATAAIAISASAAVTSANSDEASEETISIANGHVKQKHDAPPEGANVIQMNRQ